MNAPREPAGFETRLAIWKRLVELALQAGDAPGADAVVAKAERLPFLVYDLAFEPDADLPRLAEARQTALSALLERMNDLPPRGPHRRALQRLFELIVLEEADWSCLDTQAAA